MEGFVPRQSSAALGGADDVDDVIRRSAELLECTRLEFSFYSEEEEEDEEDETVSGPEDSVPPSSVVVSAGGARRARLRTRTTSSTQTCRDSGDGRLWTPL